MADEAADFGRRNVEQMLSMPEGTTLVPVGLGLLFFWISTVSLFQWLEPLSMAMAKVALHPSLWFGLLVAGRSVGELSKRLGILLCCLVHRGFGLVAGFGGLAYPSLLRTLVVGPFLLVLWLSWLLS